jgi:hypothetical protein
MQRPSTERRRTRAGRSRSKSVGYSSLDHDHHRRNTHIATLFRDNSSSSAPGSTQKARSTRKSHYIPRKASALNYMHAPTPPLTPDLSADSSPRSGASISSLVIDSDHPSITQTREMDCIPSRPKSPLDAAPNFVRKLLTRRNTTSSLRPKETIESKEAPPLPEKPKFATTASESRIPTIVLPQTLKMASKSDLTLAGSVRSRKKATSPASSKKPSVQSLMEPITTPSEPELDGYATELESDPTFAPSSEPTSGVSTPLKNKFFGFHSRSLLRSRVDIFDVKSKSTDNEPQPSFDETSPPAPNRLQVASNLPVIN